MVLTTTRKRALVGWLYLAPAVLFVTVFTAYPFVQMFWVSLTNWSLLKPPEYVGLNNFYRAFSDKGFWMALGFTLKYTIILTPILMIGGYVLALLTAENTFLKRLTRAIIFMPVVIGLGVSSLLWLWLFSGDYSLINRVLVDLGVVSKPPLWLGVDANLSLWAIIVSITWKVIGFGMILFVAAIHAVPSEINEAAMVDGAGFWRRTWLITLPLTLRTVLLVTLISVIGSLLAFDQFYIMTNGQPYNRTASTVFFVYLNTFPYLKLGYGAALSLILAFIILTFTIVQLILTRRTQA